VSTSPVSGPDVLERLQEESMRLSSQSISRGDLDSGLAANIADAAIYEIERLRGLVDQLNFVVSSGHAQSPDLPVGISRGTIDNILSKLDQGAEYQGYPEGFGFSWTKLARDAATIIRRLAPQGLNTQDSK